jgi:hypothetical protein
MFGLSLTFKRFTLYLFTTFIIYLLCIFIILLTACFVGTIRLAFLHYTFRLSNLICWLLDLEPGLHAGLSTPRVISGLLVIGSGYLAVLFCYRVLAGFLDN